LDRACQILDFLYEGKKPFRPSEIATGIGAPKSTTYDIVNLMVRQRLLEHIDDDGRVFLGRKLHYLGLSYLDQFDLTREAQRYLEKLSAETKETGQLCVAEDGKYVIALACEGSRHFKIRADVGEPLPLPWTASGRLLVMHMSDSRILQYIPDDDFLLPNGTPIEKDRFIADVREVRRTLFFSCDSVSDSFVHCLAAPILNHRQQCVATLCLVAPREDAASNYESYKNLLSEYASQLTFRVRGSTAPFHLIDPE
jgi:DNA-binding IclR family transcriptional regulator